MLTKVIGHELAQNYLLNSLKSNNLTHAYLFTGHRGVGKTTLVKFFIEHLFKTQRDLAFESNPDILWIKQNEGKKDIIIDQIREIIDFIKLKSWVGNFRIVVVEGADKLNQEASNALLKTLEEPLPRSILILITNNLHKLLPTIISRCQVINLTPVNENLMRGWLAKENLPKKEVENIIHLSQGNPGRAWDAIKNKNNLDLTMELGSLLLNFLQTTNARSILDFILVNILKLLEVSKKRDGLAQDNMNLLALLRTWLEISRDLLLCKCNQLDKLTFYALKDELLVVANKLSMGQLIVIIKLLDQAREKIRANSNSKLTIEWLIIAIKTIL
ncbi:MAG: AAA family ATPase [Patescibacteria group bacterium]